MQTPPRILTNAWFERMFDTLAWDIMARGLFVLSFGWLLHSGVIGLLAAWGSRAHDGWQWFELAVRTLGIANNAIPILIVIIRRRPVARMRGFGPKIVALAGTFLPISLVLLPYQQVSAATSVVAAAVLLVGGILVLWTWPHLGRSYSLMAEARELKTTGPYRLVRHPLYLFEEINVAGIYLFYVSPLATLILAVQIACQLIRIRNEERVLSQVFPEYRAYRETTAALIPGIY